MNFWKGWYITFLFVRFYICTVLVYFSGVDIHGAYRVLTFYVPDFFPTTTASLEIGALNQNNDLTRAPPVANSWLRHWYIAVFSSFRCIHGIHTVLSLELAFGNVCRVTSKLVNSCERELRTLSFLSIHSRVLLALLPIFCICIAVLSSYVAPVIGAQKWKSVDDVC